MEIKEPEEVEEVEEVDKLEVLEEVEELEEFEVLEERDKIAALEDLGEQTLLHMFPDCVVAGYLGVDTQGQRCLGTCGAHNVPVSIPSPEWRRDPESCAVRALGGGTTTCLARIRSLLVTSLESSCSSCGRVSMT